MKCKLIALLSLVFLWAGNSLAQTLRLADALNRSVENYDRIKSMQSAVSVSELNTVFQKQQYLPEVTVAVQQSFGTINVLHGPMYAYGGLASAATSMPSAEQNWNAAFGSLYFAAINWNLYTFGRAKNEVQLSLSKENLARADLQQEIFQHQVKVGAAYLNLLASQRLQYVQRKNYERAQVFYEMTNSRAQSGLIPEVDASLARAEVSNARSMEIRTYDKVLELSKQLAVLLGEDFKTYDLDSLYSKSVPTVFLRGKDNTRNHPSLVFQQSKIAESLQREQVFRLNRLPGLSAFGVVQGRGSGFESNYAQDKTAYSRSYVKGVGIDRGNYLAGFTLSWNITNLYRFTTRVKEQQLHTQSLQQDFAGLHKELDAQSKLAQSQFNNAMENFKETELQLASAQLAYKQHTALYENGLTTLIEFTQALYSLNRAEIGYEIARNNVWQALLLWASAQGDISILVNNPE